MSKLGAILRSTRPGQWPKNLAVFAGLFFSRRLGEPAAIAHGIAAWAAFTLTAAAVYLLNDIADREEDRAHPRKSRRPVASGELDVGSAALSAATLAAGGGGLAWWLGPRCAAVLGLYLAQSLLYSVALRRLVLVDALTIASGFVLRVVLGVWAIRDPLTPWIVLCSFTLATFMALGKRASELRQGRRRAVLGDYGDMKDLLVVSATLAIGCYALFTVLSGKNTTLVLTTPFVLYGVLRYLMLIGVDERAEDPSRLVLRDRGMLLVCLLWLLSCLTILHLDLRLFEP
jgi:4-hydroxybenzoate polyprenyltransferase